MVSTAVKAALPATAGPGFDSRLLHDSTNGWNGLEDDMEDVFDVIGYKVLIHAPAEATDDSHDQLLEYLVDLDLEDVIAEAIEAEIEAWKFRLIPMAGITVSVEQT